VGERASVFLPLQQEQTYLNAKHKSMQITYQLLLQVEGEESSPTN